MFPACRDLPPWACPRRRATALLVRDPARRFVELLLVELVREEVSVLRARLPAQSLESRADEARRDALPFAGRAAPAQLVAGDEIEVGADALGPNGLER